MGKSQTQLNAVAEPSLYAVPVAALDDIEEYRRLEYQRLWAWVEELAIGILKWGGLPEGAYSQWVEQYEFRVGCLTRFRSSDGDLVMPIGGAMKFNYYWQPIEWYAISPKGDKRWRCTPDNAVLLRNTWRRIPTRMFLAPIIEDMVDIKCTLRQNRDQIKQPTIYDVSPECVLTAKNINRMKLKGYSAIYTDSGAMTPRPPTITEPKRMFMGAELMDSYNNYKSELLTILGITNNEITKRAQLTEAESKTNRAEVISCLNMLLQSRQQACDEANRLFPDAEPMTIEINNAYIKQLYEQGMIDPDMGEGEEPDVSVSD